MINDYYIYIILAITVTAIPGPAVVLTIKNSIRYGYKIAVANILGNFVAMVFLSTLSAFGLGAIILASTTLFSAIKITGCMYLIYLGIKAWRTLPVNDAAQVQIKHKPRKRSSAAFKEGFGIGIANPKAIAFFTALFPQFIDPTKTFIPQFLTLILTIEVISFLVLSSYAFLASVASPYLSKKNTMILFNKLTGLSFICFGLALIYED